MEQKQKKSKRRPYICVNFECCRVYSRIYINRKRDAFVGWCPKCGHKVIAKISEDGEEGPFFTAS
ncbi:MAG: hypothetical protein HY606_01200 [Planctomycetes bacterium]|nr:hypothetical protein [Planctomycetota bacterium]